MPFNRIPRLDLDITGLNPDNKIVDEPHSLSGRPTRSISPSMGPFFGESLVVMDGARQLTRGQDFQIVELHQEATLRYGKEICSVALIIDRTVSSNVTITYQALGGDYGYSDEAIGNLFETVLADNRPVDWTNVFNKPTEYNPTIHRHLLDDLYGFEPVVDYLERIKRAITLGQSSILIEVINSLLSKFRCRELPLCLPSSKLIQYDAMLFFLSRRKILNNIWVDVKDCSWVKGYSYNVQVDTSGYPSGTTLYWELYKPELMSIGLFTTKKGTLTTNSGIQEFTIYAPSADNVMEEPVYIGIKEDPSDIDYKAVTYILNIQEHVKTTSSYGHMLYSTSDVSDLDMSIAEYESAEELRLYRQFSTW